MTACHAGLLHHAPAVSHNVFHHEQSIQHEAPAHYVHSAPASHSIHAAPAVYAAPSSHGGEDHYVDEYVSAQISTFKTLMVPYHVISRSLSGATAMSLAYGFFYEIK